MPKKQKAAPVEQKNEPESSSAGWQRVESLFPVLPDEPEEPADSSTHQNPPAAEPGPVDNIPQQSDGLKERKKEPKKERKEIKSKRQRVANASPTRKTPPSVATQGEGLRPGEEKIPATTQPQAAAPLPAAAEPELSSEPRDVVNEGMILVARQLRQLKQRSDEKGKLTTQEIILLRGLMRVAIDAVAIEKPEAGLGGLNVRKMSLDDMMKYLAVFFTEWKSEQSAIDTTPSEPELPNTDRLPVGPANR